MDEIHAAVLRLKLPKLDAWNARRAEIARRYDEALKGTDLTPSPRADWATPSLLPLRPALAATRRTRAASWPTPASPPTCTGRSRRTCSRRSRTSATAPGSLPVTERLCDEVITLPMFPELTDDEVDARVRSSALAA